MGGGAAGVCRRAPSSTRVPTAACVQASRPVVEPLAQLLAGLEEGDVLLLDAYAVAGARVAPLTSVAPLDREGTETAELDPIAAGQRHRDLVENGGDDTLGIPLIKVGVAFGQVLNEFGFGHGPRFRPAGFTGGKANVPNLYRSVKKSTRATLRLKAAR